MIIRTLTENDEDMLSEWIAAEPDHAGNTVAFYSTPGTKSVLYSDEEGPVCVVRYSSSLRLDMEFNPTVSKDRIKEAMKSQLPEIAEQAKSQGFSELVFDSIAQPLIKFCEKLGFSTCPDYRRLL
jgi:hypothetical protein